MWIDYAVNACDNDSAQITALRFLHQLTQLNDSTKHCITDVQLSSGSYQLECHSKQ